MIADILAIQTLYGITPLRDGDTVYGHNGDSGDVFEKIFETLMNEPDPTEMAITLLDTGGRDTLDLRTDTTDQIIDLRPAGISSVYGLRGNLVIAFDTIIEEFVAGSGNDVIVGNSADNVIRGGLGTDTIEGLSGADVIDGGQGSDIASYRPFACGREYPAQHRLLRRLRHGRACRGRQIILVSKALWAPSMTMFSQSRQREV